MGQALAEKRQEDCRVKGRHPALRAAVSLVENLAARRCAVVIRGERGTGKELLARHLHERAGAGPFVRVDCADSVPLGLDAAAHASRSRFRLLQRSASGGTLFLDELSALPIELQDRLPEALRAAAADFQDGTPRVIASVAEESGRSLGDRLSHRLLSHLAAIEVVLPALRHRRSDIPVLVDHFIAAFSDRHGVHRCAIEREALVRLWRHDWPGNIRELESVLERLVVLCRGTVIRAAHLPAHLRLDLGGAQSGTANPDREPLPALTSHLALRSNS